MATEQHETDIIIPAPSGTTSHTLRCETYLAAHSQVARARRMVAQAVNGHPKCDDAILLVSELVTNVVRHSGAQRFTLSVGETVDGDLLITVTDNGRAATTPHLRTPHPEHVSGRGICLVDQLAKQWGITRDRTIGVAVWLLLDGRPAASGMRHEFAGFNVDEVPCLA